MTSTPSPLTSGRRARRLIAAALAAAAALPRPIHADAILDFVDPLLANGVHVALPPGAIAPDALSVEFTASGVTFRFDSLTGRPLGSTAGGGMLVWGFGGAEGVLVTISPPVGAIAFRGRELDGRPGGTFVGSGSTEFVASPDVFGAGNIGSIGTVALNAPGVYRVTEMTFVPLPAGPGRADLSVAKTESRQSPGFVLNGDPLDYRLRVESAGPHTAPLARITDFLPRGALFDSASAGGMHAPDVHIVTWAEGAVAPGAVRDLSIEATVQPDPALFSCNGRLTNIATASGGGADPALANNLSVVSTFFDNGAMFAEGEVCGDGIDNNCDGRADCADAGCNCRPTLPAVGGGNPQCNDEIIFAPPEGPPVIANLCSPADAPAEGHACVVPRGRCGGRTLPAFCCDAGRLSDPSPGNLMQLQACNVGVPGCAPLDPNFKESDPPVNVAGFGYTEAGRSMSYTIHYENIGNADALDVKVVDVLDPNLDETTLTIENGGTYDPESRAIAWTDPVVPPQQPRTVRFRVNVRADAPPATHVRNVGTIIFPNAVPPTRIDTEPLEHVVPDPAFPIAPRLRVRGCEPAGPGLWKVSLVNEGVGFAYNVTASIVNPPGAVTVTDGTAGFSHTDDPEPAVLATVIPNATSTSTDAVAFDTAAPDACGALDWRIRWENLRGEAFTIDLTGAPDADDDAVADAADNCPGTFNPDQADADGDGLGDACDNRPPTCDAAAAAAPQLWPPNHDFVAVDLLGVTDPDGDAVAIEIVSVYQDEPVHGPADGRTAPDARGAGGHAVDLRAERSGRGNGRVYHVGFTADDGRGGACAGTVTICVPHDQGAGATCVDDGPLFDSATIPATGGTPHEPGHASRVHRPSLDRPAFVDPGDVARAAAPGTGGGH